MKKTILSLAACALVVSVFAQHGPLGNLHETSRIKMSLNYYSFSNPLRDGTETIETLIDYSADAGFDAIDPTGYFFPGYPEAPSDEYINRVKYRAFWQGIQFSGTGVRNDFTLPDPKAREKEKQLVKDWVVVAAKLGAPLVRVFAGAGVPEGYTWDQMARWIAADIDECAEFARQYGVMIAVQNHNDFLKTADEVDKLFALIKSPAVGLLVDIGSYRQHDPYKEIEQNVKYAISWQIKESVFINGEEVKADIPRVMEIIRKSGFRGFVPLEILKPGTERERAKGLLQEMRAAWDKK